MLDEPALSLATRDVVCAGAADDAVGAFRTLATWRGLAFELVCLLHIGQIKRALGISGIETREFSRRAKTSPMAQIDLLIDRRDDVINVCEMKYASGRFAISAEYAEALRARLEAFEREARPKKALHLTMVTMEGVSRNAHSDIVQREVVADDLFGKNPIISTPIIRIMRRGGLPVCRTWRARADFIGLLRRSQVE